MEPERYPKSQCLSLRFPVPQPAYRLPTSNALHLPLTEFRLLTAVSLPRAVLHCLKLLLATECHRWTVRQSTVPLETTRRQS